MAQIVVGAGTPTVDGLNFSPAVFFDRDGVLNVDTGYPHRPENLTLLPGAGEAVALIRRRGYRAIVVTNQSGIARGLFGEKDVELFHARLVSALAKKGGAIDAFYFCPYHPQAMIERYRCDHPDRKPNPGMIERAIADFAIDRSRSILIGDKNTDIEAALAAGIRGYLFTGGNLFDFVSSILPPSSALEA
ncbi:HAD family hydrolase [Gluconacetobacter aggeris]|uniref:D,D-heptose 1,7-bisphosphate phosphatase n=2 Tax=Gluconacetobacter aggeris TaxID=1286186 RepID=A0A7W4IVR2_9PROT|nr:HAD family hydrolase [Gluconacetobacter aggeris]